MRNEQRQLWQEHVQPATTTLSKSQLQEPEGLQSSLLQIAIRHTRELTADDKYRLLTTVQDDIRDDELATGHFLLEILRVKSGRSSRLHFKEGGFERITGFAMVNQGMTREVGVYRAFYF